MAKGPPSSAYARCLCGAMGANVPNAALFVIACHCTACQCRSGGPFGTAAYFPTADVKPIGKDKIFVRPADSGQSLRNHFCPDCGVTVYWTIDRRPDLIGVALGTITGLSPGAPLHSLYERSKHHWISLDAADEHFIDGHPS